MKWIKYEYVCGTNSDGSAVVTTKRLEYNDANLVIAQNEAHNGYVIEDDGKQYSGAFVIPVDADMKGNQIKNLGDPESETDAVSFGKAKQVVNSVFKEEFNNEKGNIVSEIVNALQGLPVFGVVNNENEITITSQLAGGTYSLKYEYENGVVNDVGHITIEGVEPEEPDVPVETNQIKLSLAADGSEYVGHNGEDGYSVGYRINSAGAEAVEAGMCCSGFIPYKGETIRLKNVTVAGTKSDYVAIYKSDKSYWQVVDLSDRLPDDGNGVLTGTVPNDGQNFIRIACGVISDASILTLDTEIV